MSEGHNCFHLYFSFERTINFSGAGFLSFFKWKMKTSWWPIEDRFLRMPSKFSFIFHLIEKRKIKRMLMDEQIIRQETLVHILLIKRERVPVKIKRKNKTGTINRSRLLHFHSSHSSFSFERLGLSFCLFSYGPNKLKERRKWDWKCKIKYNFLSLSSFYF